MWFAPRRVWEVAGADLTLSPQHTAALPLLGRSPPRGIALRFPRFLRPAQAPPLPGPPAGSLSVCPAAGASFPRLFPCVAARTPPLLPLLAASFRFPYIPALVSLPVAPLARNLALSRRLCRTSPPDLPFSEVRRGKVRSDRGAFSRKHPRSLARSFSFSRCPSPARSRSRKLARCNMRGGLLPWRCGGGQDSSWRPARTRQPLAVDETCPGLARLAWHSCIGVSGAASLVHTLVKHAVAWLHAATQLPD